MLQLPRAPCCTMREKHSTSVFLLLSCVDQWTHKVINRPGWRLSTLSSHKKSPSTPQKRTRQVLAMLAEISYLSLFVSSVTGS